MKTTITLLFVLFAAFTIRAQDAMVVLLASSLREQEGSAVTWDKLSTLIIPVQAHLVQGVQQAFEIITLSNPELTAVNIVCGGTQIRPRIKSFCLLHTDLTALSYVLYDLLEEHFKCVGARLKPKLPCKICL
jgi:hypothetical protein